MFIFLVAFEWKLFNMTSFVEDTFSLYEVHYSVLSIAFLFAYIANTVSSHSGAVGLIHIREWKEPIDKSNHNRITRAVHWPLIRIDRGAMCLQAAA